MEDLDRREGEDGNFGRIQEKPKQPQQQLQPQKQQKQQQQQQRKRKSGLTSVGTQMYNSLTKLVGSHMSVRRLRSKTFNEVPQLIVAIRNQDINRVQFLLDTTLNVNVSDRKGVTPLHEASLDGNIEIMKLLLQYHAEVNKKDDEGYTCLDYAVYGGHFDCAQLLIENGANVESVQNGMKTNFEMDYL